MQWTRFAKKNDKNIFIPMLISMAGAKWTSSIYTQTTQDENQSSASYRQQLHDGPQTLHGGPQTHVRLRDANFIRVNESAEADQPDPGWLGRSSPAGSVGPAWDVPGSSTTPSWLVGSSMGHHRFLLMSMLVSIATVP